MIAKHIMILLLINILLFSLILPQMPNNKFDDWELLQSQEIVIGYTQRDFPWCKASIKLQYSIDQILPIIENVNDYHKILDSVSYSKKDDNDIAHIIINYPFPFSDREYIVHFEKIIDNNDIVYAFSTNEHLNVNINSNYVRLINAKGEWRLSPLQNGLIEVSYMWNGELRGDFPNWSLSKAWMRHGNEVLGNLRDELKDENEK